jgi:hypothetical protein
MTIVVHAREGTRPSIRGNSAWAPAEHSAIHVVDARGDLALVFLGTFLDVHVHQAAGTEGEGADVNLTVEEFEGVAIASHDEAGLARPGDCAPGALEMRQVSADYRANGGRCESSHGMTPVTTKGEGAGK